MNGLQETQQQLIAEAPNYWYGQVYNVGLFGAKTEIQDLMFQAITARITRTTELRLFGGT